MHTQTPSTTGLLALKTGRRGRIAEIRGDRQTVRRMLALGLRIGSVVNVLNHRGHSMVISNGSTRVALGPTVADKLLVEPLDE